MHNLIRLVTTFLLITASASAGAVPFTFDARTLGMGGVSVATADLATAAWANPSMLTRQRIEDDFALLIGFGGFARDDDDLLGDVVDFQDADDARRDAIDNGDLAGEIGAALDMRSIVRGIDGKVVAPEASGLLAVGIAFETFSMAVSARSDLIAGGTVTNLSCDLTVVGCDPNELFSENFNILNLEGVQATEVAVSFAKDFELFERRVSVGVKPKSVDLRSYSFSESILTIESGAEDIVNKGDKRKLGTLNTIDLGFAMDLSDNFLLGLTVRNLLSDSFDVNNSTLNYDTESTIGIAYHNKFVTVAMDLDLTENKPLLANKSFDVLKTRFVQLGAEFSAGDYVFLRAGVSKNIASDIPSGAKDTRYAVGIGFWLGFNLDIAAVVNDNVVGAMLQTGFRF